MTYCGADNDDGIVNNVVEGGDECDHGDDNDKDDDDDDYCRD